MRRSICYCEPNNALAGEIGTWKFCYTPAIALPKGTKLKFEMLTTGGRPVDWEMPVTDLKEKKNCIFVDVEGKKNIPGRLVTSTPFPYFEFTLPAEVKIGDIITITLKENRAQTNMQRRRPFHLYIDPKGKGDFREAEIFALDVRGNSLQTIRIVAPSLVAKNRRFDVVIRFEDRYGNLTSHAPEGTLMELSYEHLRENLSWKLFVPETGFLTLPNLYFNESGIYKIQLRNTGTGEKFYSSPIKCFFESDKSIYWGLLHGESENYDATMDIELCLRYFRDEKGLQFFATSPFESAEEISNDDWKAVSTKIAESNEENRFITFLGFQWFNDNDEEGLRQIVYAKDNKAILRKKEIKTNTLKKLYKSHSPKEIISIPSFSMAKDFQNNFNDFDPEFERVVEIYNAWGSSECLEKEGNPRPITSEDKKEGVLETAEGSIRKALNRNFRFGFVAGGLDDRGIYSDFYSNEQEQYSPGLTAIIAIEQTRETLFHALYNRSCYATTGERIVLGFSIAGAQIGSELSVKQKPGLALNRHITGYVAGTTKIKEVILVRNGEVFHTFHPDTMDFEFAFDDSAPLAKIALTSSAEKPPFAYYYMRAIQEDGHIGWCSPIWIDYAEVVPSISVKKTKKK